MLHGATDIGTDRIYNNIGTVQGPTRFYRVYRGQDGNIDYNTIVANIHLYDSQIEISDQDLGPNTIWHYIRRLVSDCGLESPDSPACVVAIDGDGNLAKSNPNAIFEIKINQIDGDKAELVWYYCPLEQKSVPVCFNVYCSDDTSQIDYENPVGCIGYKSRTFCSYRSEILTPLRYLFSIRAEDAAGVENNSQKQLSIQFDTLNPDAIDIMNIEAI